MSKEGYQPIKTKKTIKIIPPNTSSNVQMKKDGYTWKDLDKAWWEGFDNAKNKIEKQIAELEKKNRELEDRLCNVANNLLDSWCRNKDDYCPHLAKLEQENAELKTDNVEWEKASDKWKSLYESTNNQLTKAKELLKKIYNFEEGIETEFPKFNLVKWSIETGNFLKDSEVKK